jgi:ABC-2 type transport system ATP-binding protein
MIEVRGLTKRYGRTVAIADLSFTVEPGRVTGFLGPNGSGKSTTMRVVLGLDRATSGGTTIAGRPYRALPAPLHAVGALLDARPVHPGRRACDHLLALARSNGIARRRVDDVLGLVGLADVADRRASGFSLGMSQRLGIAAALLGDPPVLLLDEPVNGLEHRGDPLDPRPAAAPRRRGPDRAAVQPPHERDGADRRPPRRHRTGTAGRRHHRRASSGPD